MYVGEICLQELENDAHSRNLIYNWCENSKIKKILIYCSFAVYLRTEYKIFLMVQRQTSIPIVDVTISCNFSNNIPSLNADRALKRIATVSTLLSTLEFYILRCYCTGCSI